MRWNTIYGLQKQFLAIISLLNSFIHLTKRPYSVIISPSQHKRRTTYRKISEKQIMTLINHNVNSFINPFESGAVDFSFFIPSFHGLNPGVDIKLFSLHTSISFTEKKKKRLQNLPYLIMTTLLINLN